MDCYKCGSSNNVKAGFVKNVQRYKCKSCGYNFTKNNKVVSADLKRLAIHLYLENYSLKFISNIIGVSDVAIFKWINKYGDGLRSIRKKSKSNESLDLNKIQIYIQNNELLYDQEWLLFGVGKDQLKSYRIIKKEKI